LEQAVWSALFTVDRARVRLESARRREVLLAGLEAEAGAGLHRLERLASRGRISEGVLARAQGLLAALQTERTLRAVESARARTALAQGAGLPPEAPALDAAGLFAPGLQTLPERPAPGPGVLLDAVPALRAARLAYALAEARLRETASEAWPGLRLGPDLNVIKPDGFLAGGVLALDLPWPGAVAARVAGDLELREGARESVEDALAAVLAAVEGAWRERRLARDRLERESADLDALSAATWRAARARLSVSEEEGAIEAWMDALQLRSRGTLAVADALERWLIADLDCREAAGLPPGLDAEVDR
jgi:hypothetical protein